MQESMAWLAGLLNTSRSPMEKIEFSRWPFLVDVVICRAQPPNWMHKTKSDEWFGAEYSYQKMLGVLKSPAISIWQDGI